ncbi:hypothetical protein LTS18_009033 [Coniosporium uncinatum]|uniref:Uncharacterized protein n=1 Tax=Coniosporium uncinatum TaxID=93489 RepID=A0ACC3DA47_9PEZI|nr:hypothetical protein LTS18_009033 [Coniosporium uncinatum]
MTLTEEEDELLAPILRPRHAAVGLANDYFSFDREYEEFQSDTLPTKQMSKKATLTNSVYLFMRLRNIDVATAKELVKAETIKYEQEFLERWRDLLGSNTLVSQKLRYCLEAHSFQVSGNVVWSLQCPRYDPQYRYDPNAGVKLEKALISAIRKPEVSSIHAEIARVCAEDSGTKDHPNRTGHARNVSMDSSSGTADSSLTTSTASSHAITSPEASFHQSHSRSLSRNLEQGLKNVIAPFEYTNALPSKGVRAAFIDALNIWIRVPDPTLSSIKFLIEHLHTASLMLDDIQDGSDLRRGSPAAHVVFGVPITINSANFAIIQAIEATKGLPRPAESMAIVVEELLGLHIGQGVDLHWTHSGTCPSEAEYLEMVDNKTGGLFRLLARLMLANASPTFSAYPPTTASSVNELPKNEEKAGVNVDLFIKLLGQCFQIRDDYQNLNSAQYVDQKGFCEDLDEGKYSFPLVHALSSATAVKADTARLLQDILRQHRQKGSANENGMSKEDKMWVLECLERNGSMEYTRKRLKELHVGIEAEIGRLERETGDENWIMRMLVKRLEV